jgi:hypothetical protein
MNTNGYNVEFLPLERRLLERRFIESGPSVFGQERRIGERRDIRHDDVSGKLSFDLNTPLTH